MTVSRCRALSNILTIQLWQWQISNASAAESTGNDTHSLVTSLSAAKEICHILNANAQHYTPASATFILSYAAYIGASVFARIIVQDSRTISEMRGYLQTCLKCLRLQTHVYRSTERALKILEAFIERSGISLQCEENEQRASDSSSRTLMPGTDENEVASNAGFVYDAADIIADPILFSFEELDDLSRTFYAEYVGVHNESMETV